VRRLAVSVALVCACSGGNDAPERAATLAPDDAAPIVIDAAPVVVDIDEATGIPAWSAVVDRPDYLERRGARGAVVGRLGASAALARSACAGERPARGSAGSWFSTCARPEGLPNNVASGGPRSGTALGGSAHARAGDYRWLIDETVGEGALAIRVALPVFAASLPEGARVQVDGAWIVDDDRAWVWRGAGVARVASAEPIEFAYPPGHTISDIDAPPDDAVAASVLKRRGEIVFATVAPPVKPGDGWQIADEPGGDPVGWLVLPGDQAAYGGQEMRAPDERWSLEIGRRYVVRVGRVRGRSVRVLTATSPPRRLPH
jgi:hypothetical protein